jgi:sigma-B regulation protein RsbU (phosphoserine phosphatase)
MLLTGTVDAREPFEFGYRLNAISGVLPEAAAAGVHRFDVLEEVEGKPFTGTRVLDRAVDPRRAGDTLSVVVRRPDGTRVPATIRLAAIRDTPPSLNSWVVTLAVNILLPVFCLALGFWVAFARPYDHVAWLLLALMIGFSQFVGGFAWNWPLMDVALVWNAAMGQPQGAWLLWLVLFALVFPERAAFDIRRPWLKWVLLIPLILQTTVFFLLRVGSAYSYDSIAFLKPILALLLRIPIDTILAFFAIGTFFTLIFRKGSMASTSDARRRLRILYVGTVVSLFPMFILAVRNLFRGGEFFTDLPRWAIVTTLLFLLLFPLTLAYVIVVQRAMQVRMVLRQGVKYAFARGGLRAMRTLLMIGVVTVMTTAFAQRDGAWGGRTAAVGLLILVISMRKRVFDRISQGIDKRFFREAYSTEMVLSELSQEARRFTEAGPLLNTVAQRVSQTLHVPHIAVFVREQDRFCVAQTIGLRPDGAYCFPAQSRSVALLEEAHKPELVYFDDPRSWVHTAAEDEQSKLRTLDAEVLLALPGRDQLLGLIALGPKLSEEPYSASDLRLLQSVAVQTGLALENTRLLAAVAHETGIRERLNREIEIAREVQERLFPQSYPRVSGVDYFGMCRPALAVGGDYYDFIQRPNGRLGIALGDISGKGISAALMMASLHSLMRGQLAAGLDDLSALVTNTNRLIYDASTANRYATFFYGEYDPETRKLTYVNAGHNPPIILRGEEALRLDACGPVIGLLPVVRYESAEFVFQAGDVFILFTDGISEAMTIEDEEWGEDRLIDAARLCRSECATAITASLLAAADDFAAGAPQHDDMTLIALKTL